MESEVLRRLCRNPGCARDVASGNNRYCQKKACKLASKEARLAREATSIKKAEDKKAAAEAAAEARLAARLAKKKPPAKEFTFMALLPAGGERAARAVDPTNWAMMQKATAEASRVQTDHERGRRLKHKERLAALAAEAAEASAAAEAAAAASTAASAEKMARLERELEESQRERSAEKRKREEAELERPQQQPPPSPQTTGRRNMAAAAALMPPPPLRASPARAARPVPTAPPRSSSAVRSLLQEAPCAGIPEVARVEYQQHGGVLGEGAMGKVHAGTCANLAGDRVNVAIKMLHGGPASRVQDLLDEVRLLFSLRHDNVLGAFGITRGSSSGQTPGQPRAVLELCSGGSLARRLRHGGLEPAHEQRVAGGLARGLAYLHRPGAANEMKPVTIHCDLKPANVLLDAEGEPKIADFGLSVACARAATSGQERGGTPAFRAPEAWQRRGKVTVKADMFSYACVLACIAQRSDNPYDHEYPKSVLEERVPSGLLKPELPPQHRWAAIVAGCALRDPCERSSSAYVTTLF